MAMLGEEGYFLRIRDPYPGVTAVALEMGDRHEPGPISGEWMLAVRAEKCQRHFA